MSLVNDMLRDLDQRRKQSDGSGATSSLTPVPEMMPRRAKNSSVVYLVLAMALGGAAVAWFWLQQENAPTTRSLDVNPAIVNQSAVPPASTGTVTETVSNTNDSAPEVATQPQQVAPLQTIAAAAEQQLSDQQTRAILESTEAVARERELEEPSPVQLVTQQTTIETTAVSPAALAENPPSAQNQQVAGGEVPDVSTRDRQSIDVAQDGARPNTVNLNAVPTEEVKSGAALSPEERDVLAVQEALRLIADNNSTAAYSVLEKQVIDNRYAHQSRETYAKLLLNEGNLLGAMQLVESGLALSANHAGFKKIKARLLIAQGRLTEAVALLITRAPEMSKDLEYHDILATAQLASRDYEGAVISYTGLVQQDQSQGKWWYGFAASQDQLGNSEAAKQAYSRAVRMPNLSANLRRRSQERLALLGQ
ncbi:MAG: tetratricopeptide repeat protein [Proteobacteria bacterium]|nr:tetratricopeptide repeat protein [Pseudomonadota bacterium]MDA0926506.1 tetratricopeptide repeat protein [Pseudomonadota bacterium]